MRPLADLYGSNRVIPALPSALTLLLDNILTCVNNRGDEVCGMFPSLSTATPSSILSLLLESIIPIHPRRAGVCASAVSVCCHGNGIVPPTPLKLQAPGIGTGMGVYGQEI